MTKKTCLVVDDERFDRMILQKGAQGLGFSVSVAANGAEALEACKKSFPDCLLINWEMPDMNGMELLKQLQQMPDSASMRVLICTSHNHPSFVGHAYVQGANSFLTKPVNREKLEQKFKEMGLL
jgi:two-component system, chemotaxis family, chemotaxis protein CheY